MKGKRKRNESETRDRCCATHREKLQYNRAFHYAKQENKIVRIKEFSDNKNYSENNLFSKKERN